MSHIFRSGRACFIFFISLVIMFCPLELSAEDNSPAGTETPAAAEDTAETDNEGTMEEVIEAEKVEPLPPFRQEVLFEDSFEDNSNNWITEKNPIFSTYVENGLYIISQSAEDSTRAITNFSFSLPADADFVIDALIDKVRVGNDAGFGLIWGSVDINNQYRFYISDTGNYSIVKRKNGVTSDVVAWTMFQDTGRQKNKLTILKYGDNTHFYVNDEHVETVPDLSLFGGRIGFVMEGGQTISIEHIRVAQIEPENPGNGNAYPEKPAEDSE